MKTTFSLSFRAQHSTELASVKLVDYIIKGMDDAHGVKTPVAIYYDLSMAFDCLNVDIFLSKLTLNVEKNIMYAFP